MGKLSIVDIINNKLNQEKTLEEHASDLGELILERDQEVTELLSKVVFRRLNQAAA